MANVRYKPLHVGISVSDLEKAIEWFGDILGFSLRLSTDLTPMGFRAAFLDNGGGFEIELFESSETKPVPKERLHPDTDVKTQGTKHLAFEVTDLNKELAYFETKGIKPLLGPIESFGLYVAYIYGPDNVLIEFIEWNR